MQKIFFFITFLLGMAEAAVCQPKCNCNLFDDKVRKAFEKVINTGQFDAADTIALAQQKSKDPCCQAISYTLQSIILNGRGKSEESLASAHKAQDILRRSFNLYASVESNRMIGFYYHKAGNADTATIFYLKGLEQATASGEQYLISRMLTSIATLYANRKQEQKALEYQKRSVAAALISGDTTVIAHAYSYLVTCYGRVYDDTENEIYVDSAAQVATTDSFLCKSYRQQSAGHTQLSFSRKICYRKTAI